MAQELKIDAIIKGGFSKGLQNVVPISINLILWIITIWIPYLNIGTTIGMLALPAKMSKGDTLLFTEVFNPIYRKRMGEFFILIPLMNMGIAIGLVLVVIPGLIILLAWSLSILLLIDKEMNPLEAINQSNTFTFGHKATMFFGYLILYLIIAIAFGILFFIGSLILKATNNNFALVGIFGLIMIVIELIVASIFMGAQATVYANLVE